MKIAVAGSGAFGTALAISFASDEKDIVLVSRSEEATQGMKSNGINPKLPDCPLPTRLRLSSESTQFLDSDIVLLAIPTQDLRGFLETHKEVLAEKYLVACCKGIDLTSLEGPSSVIQDVIPSAKVAMLTGPSFAADIAKGLPTALTLAMKNELDGELLQHELTTANLRLYRTTDLIGAELGGALKNVIAIGAGVAIGGNLGDSARAALMARGFSEMRLLSEKLGAEPATLNGLSGFGDLALTCTSELSRNYCHGLAIGKGEPTDNTKTVEGASTAKAVVALSYKLELDLPVCQVVAALCNGTLDQNEALASLLARPLKEE